MSKICVNFNRIVIISHPVFFIAYWNLILNPTASLRLFRLNTLFISIEVSRLCFGTWISAWVRKCWRTAELICVISSYSFQRTSVSCVSWLLASRGEVTSHSSLPVVLDRVLYIGYLTADTLWLLFMEKGKVCVLCGARLPAGIASAVTCRIPFDFKTLLHSCHNFRARSYWNNLECNLFLSVSTCKAGENCNLITNE